MGYAASVNAVVGVKVERKSQETTVTRYNEKTGEPYQHPTVDEMLIVGSRVWSDDGEPSGIDGLHFYETNCEHEGNIYYGKELNSHATQEELKEAWDAAVAALAKLDVPADQVQLHTFLYESY